jgi:hypothetical protein
MEGNLMGEKLLKNDCIFLLLCVILGIVGEEAFFKDQMGISYFVFIISFYTVFFWRFRKFPFSHQRVGYFVLICIWLLTSGYYLYDTQLFYALNIVVIPVLVIFHLALVTASKNRIWHHFYFFIYTFLRVIDGLRYHVFFTQYVRNLSKNGNKRNFVVWKKIILGITLSLPVLFIVLNLLISADAQFERLVKEIPYLFSINVELLLRTIIVLVYAFGFFGFMQALFIKNNKIIQKEGPINPISMDGVVTLTVLLLLDFVYIAFVAVQFTYFFSGSLEDGYTYAEYARRGFFELLFVTMINLSVITASIQLSRTVYGNLKRFIRIALSVLVLSSMVLLISAFIRMMMYEEAYGYTFTRVLAHSFMIFLTVIFAYTLVKIWLEKLSLFHFYFISALIYYVGINVVNIDQFVVEQNIMRYETTEKIDIYYLNNLSDTGTLGLIDLYQSGADIPGLEELLIQRKADRLYIKNTSWQSYNLTRNKTYNELGKINFLEEE